MVEKSEPFNACLSITTYAFLHSHLLSSSGFCIPIPYPHHPHPESIMSEGCVRLALIVFLAPYQPYFVWRGNGLAWCTRVFLQRRSVW